MSALGVEAAALEVVSVEVVVEALGVVFAAAVLSEVLGVVAAVFAAGACEDMLLAVGEP